MVYIISSNVSNYQDILLQTFQRFLLDEKVSEKTRVNYLADVRHFLTWLIGSFLPKKNPILSHTDLLKLVSKDLMENYKRTMTLEHTPVSTVNRRLSSLRMFFRCVMNHAWLSDNPMEYIANIPKADTGNVAQINSIIHRFISEDLKEESEKQINYRTYLQEFFDWLETHHNSL